MKHILTDQPAGLEYEIEYDLEGYTKRRRDIAVGRNHDNSIAFSIHVYKEEKSFEDEALRHFVESGCPHHAHIYEGKDGKLRVFGNHGITVVRESVEEPIKGNSERDVELKHGDQIKFGDYGPVIYEVRK
jgi:pSer/pThr/pTyr-binding forkhead associated (FHA) protein